MLKSPACFVLVLALVTSVSARARSDEEDDALRKPERITVGFRDQFLGELAPDEKTLYFVSNRATRKEIYEQDTEQGHAKRAFDEGAEATWPRVSPDGKALLYISFREQATGQLCVRSLPDADDRRCLEGAPSALQAQWIDCNRILVITRTSIHGDLRVSEVSVGARLTARTLFDRNWSSPAVSPDRRWLVYVPLDRAAKRVGPGFAARAAPRLEAVRFDGSGMPVSMALDLPGMSAQPAFSRDGRFLYFVQFFSDSNHDGVIDAADHGVLFRVPFASDADDAPARAGREAPVQLTDAGLNCQYPAPAAHYLVTTCSHDHDLDVYELPLEGEIPDRWSAERLHSEAELATRYSERLLFYRDLLAHQTNVTARRLTLMRMVMAHLELEEFDAAEFYAKDVAELREPATRGIGRPLLVLVEHRRARNAEEHGKTTGSPLADAEKRLDLLRDDPKFSAGARALRRVVASEIADWMGDKDRAKRELEAAAVDDDTPSSVTAMYFARADALYREFDDRDALVALCRRLSVNRGLTADERLEFARAAVRALVRGRPFDEVDALLARERRAEAGDSDFGFALELGRAVFAIRSGRPGRELRAKLLALYDAQERPERRRAIVLDAIERAADAGADAILEGLAERYIDDVARGTEEWRRASRVYRRALLGRAYRRLARGRLAEARADFDAVMKRTESFEALVESIELRLEAGERPEAIEQELKAEQKPSAAPTTAGDFDPWAASKGHRAAPLADFVRAYLDARELQHLTGEAHAKTAADARAHLRASWEELRDKGPVRALYATILHEEYLHTGAADAAEKANAHYMVALELLQRNPRYVAVVLGMLGLLHTQVGNYRIALGYLQQRQRLPFADPVAELAVRLATARALLHVGREKEAAAMANTALALVERVAGLAPYRMLALDRAALYNLGAGHFDRALALYDAEVPLLSAGHAPADRRTRFVVRLARAASAVGAHQPGRALDDLSEIEPGLDDSMLVAALAAPFAAADQAIHSYRSIATGLRANANQALGRLDEAGRALERYRALSAQRWAESGREEDIRGLTLVEARLAANAAARRDLSSAAKWIGYALDHADGIVARTRAAVDPDQLQVLRLGAELQVLRHAPVTVDLRKRVEEAHQRLASLGERAYGSHQRWFEVYLALTGARADGVKREAGVVSGK